jgi:curved DNA-binding protein CbpA
MKNYYKILNVCNYAEAKVIRASFKRLAHQIHPDRNLDEESEKKFKEINTAYQVLSDPKKRMRYDYLLELSLTFQLNNFEEIFNHENEPIHIAGSSNKFYVFRYLLLRKIGKIIYWFLKAYTEACYIILVPFYYIIVFIIKVVKIIFFPIKKCASLIKCFRVS